MALFSADHWQSVYDAGRRQFVRGNLYYHGILKLLVASRPIRFVVNLGNYQLGTRFLREKRRESRVAYKPFEAYTGWGSVRRAWAAFRRFRREIRKWARDPQFTGTWNYAGVDCSSLAAERLDLLAGGPLFEAILAVETAERLLDQDRPAALLIDSEQGRPGKALIGAAQARGIPTLSLAHGITSVDSAYHNLVPQDQALGERLPACRFPFPDLVTLYAQADFDLLTGQGGFPPARLRVTGAPRWDWLVFARELFPREVVCREYGLDPGKPIVLFTAQELPSRDEEEELLRAVGKACRGIAGVQLVVKMHPTQTDAQMRWYRRVIEDSGAPIRVLERLGAKLYPLLSVSDVLVTVGCTTAIEAGLLDRPVIVLDFYGRGYRNYYLKPHGLLEATTPTRLDGLLRQVLFDRPFRESLRDARAEFLREYASLSDGKAAERVVELLGQLLSSRGQSL